MRNGLQIRQFENYAGQPEMLRPWSATFDCKRNSGGSLWKKSVTMEEQMKRFKRNVALTGVVLALVALMAMNVRAQEKNMDDKMSGQEMIDMSKATVVIIHADWCPACQKLKPTLEGLRKEYKDRLNFVVLDVTTEEKVAEAVKTAGDLGIGEFFDANKKNTSTVVVLGENSKIGFKTTHNYDRKAYVKAFDDAIKMNTMMMKK